MALRELLGSLDAYRESGSVRFPLFGSRPDGVSIEVGFFCTRSNLKSDPV